MTAPAPGGAHRDVRWPPDVVVVGGGVIGLAVAWRAAGPGGRWPWSTRSPGGAPPGPPPACWRRWPRPTSARRTWPRLNLAARPGVAGVRPRPGGRLRPPGPLPGRRDPGGGRRPVGPGRHRPGARLPPGHGAAGRPARRPRPAATPSRCSPPGVSGGVDLPGDHQVDNRAVAVALEAACRAAGVDLVADRVDAGGRWPTAGSGGVVAGGRRVPGRRPSWWWPPAAGRAALAGLPEAWRPPVRPVRGVTVRLAAPDGRAAPAAHRAGPRPRAVAATSSPGTTAGSCSGPPWRSGASPSTCPLGGRGRPGRGRPAGRARPRRVRGGRGHARACAPARPTTGPSSGPTPVDGLVVATGHFRNGILLAPAHRRRGGARCWRPGRRGGRRRRDPSTPSVPSRFAVPAVAAP